MRVTRRLVAALAIGACGCVHTNAAVLNPSLHREPLCPDAVVLYTSADKVGKDYEEIAILNSKGESGWTSEKGMYNSQRKKAAKLGANGVILNNINEPKAGTKIIGAILGVGSERKGSAMAIYVPADSDLSRQACAKK